jgi:hypothetical protein
MAKKAVYDPFPELWAVLMESGEWMEDLPATKATRGGVLCYRSRNDAEEAARVYITKMGLGTFTVVQIKKEGN